MRTTKVEVESVFKAWLLVIGGHEATSYNDVGGYRLDYAACYGGYAIERICNEHGGVEVVLSCRLSPYYLVQSLNMAMRTIEHMRANNVEVA